ncbi:cupin [Lapidilactobacillus mulanensis]|uniref:Cupin n=1 Tax=Lapidilactobacillus mulanensis TaxID=2485999 RepID=A0ABW4DN21_9LACO|nr:cupin [Lapidilactobacillus mulanensis]
MKVYTGRTDIDLYENLFQTPNQAVTHLVLAAGQTVPVHHADYSVVVVPIKGHVNFSDETTTEEIYPGKIVQMRPNEDHALAAIDDCELMVIKSTLAE